MRANFGQKLEGLCNNEGKGTLVSRIHLNLHSELFLITPYDPNTNQIHP